MARSERGELHAPGVIEPVGTDEEGVGPVARKRREGHLDLAAGAGVQDLICSPSARAAVSTSLKVVSAF